MRLNILKTLAAGVLALSLGSAGIVGSASAAPVLFDFESGAQGWTTGADATTVLSIPTGGANSWALAGSLPGTIGVALGGTWWTNPNDGTAGAERSFVLSPLFTADASPVSINFDSYNSNEGGYPTHYDVEHIQIAINGGTFADVHGFDVALHTFGDKTFRNITYVTGALLAGDTFQYRFLYDTGDNCCGPTDVTGWAFDNATVTGSVTQDVSEPGTLALFGLGLAGLGYMRRRRTT